MSVIEDTGLSVRKRHAIVAGFPDNPGLPESCQVMSPKLYGHLELWCASGFPRTPALLSESEKLVEKARETGRAGDIAASIDCLTS